jgi:cephalosporin hydroxylase
MSKSAGAAIESAFMLRGLIARQFQKLYYDAADRTWANTRWRGVPVLKCPLDLWVYQEIIHETRPDLIVETGTSRGGSALFLCDVLDAVGHGDVISVDVREFSGRPAHRRLTYRTASSIDRELVAWIGEQASGRRTMVILDSDHSQTHVRAELEAYAPLVTPGCYLIVEDTNVNGHPVAREHGAGPFEAVLEFLDSNAAFVPDHRREKHFLTFNPHGYLEALQKRVA